MHTSGIYKIYRNFTLPAFILLIITALLNQNITIAAGKTIRQPQKSTISIDSIGEKKGICIVLADINCNFSIKLAKNTQLLIYTQIPNERDVLSARTAAKKAGLYGTQIFVEKGSLNHLHLADNLADIVIVLDENTNVGESEILRVLRPKGTVLWQGHSLTKPLPDGIDDWSHPYHGPDNNPQSEDRVIKAPYLTQFLADPRYGPVPQVAVASAGKVFKAFGNVAFHEREEPYLDTLVAFNGYNGTILWKRSLTPGIMVHRNTIIATEETLYLGDDKSCKLIDPATGEVKDEITPPVDIAGGTFWKWMALENGVLYALIGEQEQKDPVMKWKRTVHGWPWEGISKGYNQWEHPWGFGSSVLAIDPKTKKVLWHYHEEKPIDSRAMCMKNGRIFFYRYGSLLTCLNAETGDVIWRKTNDNAPELFEALGFFLPRQSWQTNWRTAAYLKCSDKALYFAGPPMDKLLAVSTEDGSILWTNEYDNFQLVLRQDGLYGLSGEADQKPSKTFNPLTGSVLDVLDTRRRACTRPTGSTDAIFYRAQGGTVRLDIPTQTPHWISLMRPNCHDGVTVANGLLYWWPSVCDCQLSLYGVSCLGPAANFEFGQKATENDRLETFNTNHENVAALPESPHDWPAFRANKKCNATTKAVIPQQSSMLWSYKPEKNITTSPPVTAGGLVFVGNSDGIVKAIDAATGQIKWEAFTAGAIRIPPTIWKGHALVGSADGWVYNFEAKTGNPLWRFRAAPMERKIPVYSSLSSTWPASSGVIVEDGTAYVAAGIANYDGTHIYAIDAKKGNIKWQNNTSGHLEPDARTGVSVQGHMLINDGKLYLAGGTSISPAVYDIKDGKCLNDPEPLKLCHSTDPRGWQLFLLGDYVMPSGQSFYGHPDQPVYDFTVFNKILLAPAGEHDIIWYFNGKTMNVACFDKINRAKLNETIKSPQRTRTGTLGKLGITKKPVWSYDCGQSNSVAIAQNAVLVATQSELIALDINNGRKIWSQQLPAAPVPWGLAVDHSGQTIVTLKNGNVVCFGTKSTKVAKYN